MIRADKITEAGLPPSPEMLAAMGALMDEETRSGALLGGEGLKPSADGARIRRSGGKTTVIDGPFAESKELIAGFTMLQLATKAEAIAFAKRWLPIRPGRRRRVRDGIRPLFELTDFPVDANEKADGWRNKEAELRTRLGEL